MYDVYKSIYNSIYGSLNAVHEEYAVVHVELVAHMLFLKDKDTNKH